MLCNEQTCRRRGINCFDSSGSEIVPDHEFCTQLRHMKCKVARLARIQIQKISTGPNLRAAVPVYRSANARKTLSRGTTHSGPEENFNPRVDEAQEIPPIGEEARIRNRGHIGNGLNGRPKIDPDEKLEANILEPELPVVIPRHLRPELGHANVVPGAKLFGYWIRCILKCFTKRLKVMLIAVIIGIIMWMALVYGAILGASMCSTGQAPFFQFSSPPARVSVF